MLHIGARHSDAHVQEFYGYKASKKSVGDSKSSAGGSSHHKERNPKVAWLLDKLSFIVVSGAVFFVVYGVLNWQALLLNGQYYWDRYQGKELILEDLVVEKNPQQVIAQTSDIGLARGTAPLIVPPLDIEIMPTDTRLVIPRINQNVPIVGVRNENLIERQWDELEKDIQNALRNGVIHYPGTALPGDGGNFVVTGHSSFYAWDPGRFKDVFALLHDVRIKDKIIVYFNQEKFIYEVSDRTVVLPKDVDVLKPSPKEQLTLITCTPIGTNLKRLVLTARLVAVE